MPSKTPRAIGHHNPDQCAAKKAGLEMSVPDYLFESRAQTDKISTSTGLEPTVPQHFTKDRLHRLRPSSGRLGGAARLWGTKLAGDGLRRALHDEQAQWGLAVDVIEFPIIENGGGEVVVRSNSAGVGVMGGRRATAGLEGKTDHTFVFPHSNSGRCTSMRLMSGGEGGASGGRGSGVVRKLLGTFGPSLGTASMPKRARPSSSSLAVGAFVFVGPSCSQRSGLLPSPSVPSCIRGPSQYSTDGISSLSHPVHVAIVVIVVAIIWGCRCPSRAENSPKEKCSSALRSIVVACQVVVRGKERSRTATRLLAGWPVRLN
ncbi:hypothetical protein EDD18DRAFT_1104592 [Armillaria luteobubalina]|uniref:Uncharacterized protein n=1 Tax=Armillaria luteobubalina TaxID=153913 RepID=A0AA39Q6F6_9AGAR|nr:hypothetical protein EDD18DRAFT_1104592 [Armillaria luteobubalina]